MITTVVADIQNHSFALLVKIITMVFLRCYVTRFVLTVVPPVQETVDSDLLELQTNEDVKQVAGNVGKHQDVGDPAQAGY